MPPAAIGGWVGGVRIGALVGAAVGAAVGAVTGAGVRARAAAGAWSVVGPDDRGAVTAAGAGAAVDDGVAGAGAAIATVKDPAASAANPATPAVISRTLLRIRAGSVVVDLCAELINSFPGEPTFGCPTALVRGVLITGRPSEHRGLLLLSNTGRSDNSLICF